MKVAALVVLIILLVIVSPFITIWALNTLFLLSIPYTFWTWLAVICLGGVFNRASSNK